MVGIMSELHQYVPTKERTTTCSVSTEGEETQEEMLDVKCHRVLFAGDQLTVERARSARAQRNNSEDAKGRLQGFVPVAQDWHAGQCFLGVRLPTYIVKINNHVYMYVHIYVGCMEKAVQ